MLVSRIKTAQKRLLLFSAHLVEDDRGEGAVGERPHPALPGANAPREGALHALRILHTHRKQNGNETETKTVVRFVRGYLLSSTATTRYSRKHDGLPRQAVDNLFCSCFVSRSHLIDSQHLRRCVELNRPAKNASLFFSTFPMFVRSLSW